MALAGTIRMNARQYSQLGEDPPGVRLELVDGEIEVSPSPTPEHSKVCIDLAGLLKHHLREANLGGRVLGNLDHTITEFTVRRPDVLYFSAARSHLVTRKAVVGSADLCVEVVSPSSVHTDREAKLSEYAAAGVEHYWIIDPEQKTAEAYALVDRQYNMVASGAGNAVVRFPPFPTLEIPLAELWW